MTSKGPQGRLGATNPGPRPGGFPLGSAQSRAAARALLAAREANEEQLRVQCVSVVDGRPVYLDGLAERLNAARKRIEAGELADAPLESGDERESEGTWEERLEERMRQGRERVAQAQGLDSTL